MSNFIFIVIILDILSSVKTFYLVLNIIISMDKNFCDNLKALRKISGLTQKDVAKKLNVVESCYANWEQGRTEPSISTLRTLSKIFNISIDEMIG